MTAADLFHQTAADHRAGGDLAAAREIGLAGLRSAPDHPGLHELVGLAEFELEDYARAVHHLETASAIGPLGIEGQLALADCYRRFGLVQAAVAVLDFLAEPDRCPVPLLPTVARGLGQLGRYSAALAVCLRLTALRPGYHPAWFGVAFYLRQLGGPGEPVVRALEMAHGLAPDALTYKLNLAAEYADLGRLADAHALVRDVPADAVGCGCLCRRLARAFAAAGDVSGQIAYLARAGGTTGGSRPHTTEE